MTPRRDYVDVVLHLLRLRRTRMIVSRVAIHAWGPARTFHATTKRAIFITHRALPGRRQGVIEVWETHFKPLVEASGHDAYFYTIDDSGPDTTGVFQQYATIDAQDDLLSSRGYAEYEAAVEPLLALPPEVHVTTPALAIRRLPDRVQQPRSRCESA